APPWPDEPPADALWLPDDPSAQAAVAAGQSVGGPAATGPRVPAGRAGAPVEPGGGGDLWLPGDLPSDAAGQSADGRAADGSRGPVRPADAFAVSGAADALWLPDDPSAQAAPVPAQRSGDPVSGRGGAGEETAPGGPRHGSALPAPAPPGDEAAAAAWDGLADDLWLPGDEAADAEAWDASTASTGPTGPAGPGEGARPGGGLSPEEARAVASWDRDLDALEGELRRTREAVRDVELPSALSASQLLRLAADEQACLL
ncbi:hypothetical protein HYE82_36930, partial [Streptomyces sp. BR123]|nr:hypothetical protein [Streptomyces sp. BR123]